MLARLLAMLGIGRSVAPPAPAVDAPGAAHADEVQPARAALTGAAVGLTPRDLDRLRGVHPDLVRVVVRARAMDAFFVSEGVRTEERQRQLVREGKSRTMASRHLTGHAVDLYPISATPIAAIRRAANRSPKNSAVPKVSKTGFK